MVFQPYRLAPSPLTQPRRHVEACRDSTKRYASQASILFDKCHIMCHLGDALNTMRKRDYARLSGNDQRFINGQKYTLLSHWRISH